ncbi:MAG: hypothetical protein LUQ59_10190 [Methanothrix sp.]|nr:hypothetical protein [Methanothrix sp.]
MNKMLLIVCLCCAALFAISSVVWAAESDLTVLTGDSTKNYSEMNYSLFSAAATFGYLDLGEAVKFKAPVSGWKLQKVRILAYSEFNETDNTYMPDRNIMIEIRDKDLKLLYKFADAQNMYFLSTEPVFVEIEIPEVKVTGDFYVVYYDRAAAPIGMVNVDEPGNSFLFQKDNIQPAQFALEDTNETIAFNWMIEAIGSK